MQIMNFKFISLTVLVQNDFVCIKKVMLNYKYLFLTDTVKNLREKFKKKILLARTLALNSKFYSFTEQKSLNQICGD